MREPQFYIHGNKLKNKLQENPELQPVHEEYMKWKERSLSITQRNQEAVFSLVQLLNEYKGSVEPLLDKRKNSAQEVLQPSIIDEFFEYLFCNIEDELSERLLRGPSSAFIDLVFNPKNLHSLATHPEYTLRRKDHDFVIGSTVALTFSIAGIAEVAHDSVVVPAVAIECKRYLERNMLDECSGTAEKVKKATPYCLYFIVAEYLKMDDCRPELSKIDEIYILRRQKNSDRLAESFIPNPIYGDLVWDIYSRVLAHLGRIWWDPNSALTTGKLFNI